MSAELVRRAFWSTFWHLGFAAYFLLLSWQLLTPVTLVVAGGWDKVYHFVGFAVLAGLAMLAWHRAKPLTIVYLLFGYAALTEILQHFIVGRSFSILDGLADFAGVVVATVITLSLLNRFKILKSLLG